MELVSDIHAYLSSHYSPPSHNVFFPFTYLIQEAFFTLWKPPKNSFLKRNRKIGQDDNLEKQWYFASWARKNFKT